MNKIKITDHQVFALTSCFTCGSAILVISATIASFAKQDAWIAMLVTLTFGLFEIWIVCFLWSSYPNMTYIEMIKEILGKWVGNIISIYFIFFCLLVDSQICWYIGNFVTIQSMPQTPAYAINILFFTTVSIALLYGLESIARSYEVFVYFISFLFILSIILVSPNAKIENLQPVLEGGIIPVLKASILSSSFLIFPIIILLMVFPVNANYTKKAKKAFIKGYLWGGSLVFLSIIFPILVLGTTITASSQYPVYILAKEINLGTVFTRLEFIVAAVWIITLLTRGIFYFYAAVIGLAQLLKLKDYKKIIIPLWLIVVVISGDVFTDVINQSDWDTLTWPPFAATFGVIIPIIMIIGFCVRRLLKIGT